MIVTIMYRNTYEGGDGWIYGPMVVEIADTCPICGSQRGVPYPHRFCEDGEWMDVDKWDNPCGHVDKYRDAFHESKRISAKEAV